METVARIRIRVADGEGIRATAREFEISRNTVRKALEQGEAGFVHRKRKQRSSILDSFKETLHSAITGYPLVLQRIAMPWLYGELLYGTQVCAKVG